MLDFLNQLKPKTSFFAGMASSVLAIGTVGFVVLLAAVLSGGGVNLKTARANTAAQPTVREASPSPALAPLPSAAPSIRLAAITDKDHIRGNKDAEITIVEFSDLECPFCKRFHPTMQQVIEEYGDKVRWVYKHFPLTQLHPKAQREAEATECAAELGGNDAFWKYTDRLFEITPSNNGLADSQLPQIAEDVGLNRVKFEKCLNSGRSASIVADHLAQANAAGGRGTPYSVVSVGGENIPMSGALPFAQVKSMLDQLIQ
jgi:protein-disulfide isomerase